LGEKQFIAIELISYPLVDSMKVKETEYLKLLIECCDYLLVKYTKNKEIIEICPEELLLMLTIMLGLHLFLC